MEKQKNKEERNNDDKSYQKYELPTARVENVK